VAADAFSARVERAAAAREALLCPAETTFAKLMMSGIAASRAHWPRIVSTLQSVSATPTNTP
jgi:hypothetical protein